MNEASIPSVKKKDLMLLWLMLQTYCTDAATLDINLPHYSSVNPSVQSTILSYVIVMCVRRQEMKRNDGVGY